MISQDNWLNLGHILIFEVVGSPVLFGLLGLIVLHYQLFKLNFAFQVHLVASFLWIGLITSYIYNSLWWMIGLLVMGVVIYTLYTRMVKK